MFDRNLLKAMMLIGIVLPFAGCTNQSGLDSIEVTPATASLVVGGPTLQMAATGTFGNAKDPSTQTITSQVTWTSAIPGVATVNSAGLVTAVGAGTTTITGTAAGFAGPVSSSADIIVTSGGTGSVGGDIVSLAIIPTSQTVAAPGQTGQFLAIGSTSSGATENLTSQVAWSSSSASVATISAAGTATAVAQGNVTITAVATNPDKTVATGTGTFTVTGGTSEQITALTIIPGNESLSASGQTGQLIALGTSGTTGLQVNVTNSPNLQWVSSIPTIATVCNNSLPVTKPVTCTATTNGLVAGVGAGSTAITAIYTNPDNSVVAPATPVTVTITNTPVPEPLLTLTIVPSAITVGNLNGTGNFLAIGTYSTQPQVRDLTNSVTWISSAPNVFPVNTNSNPTNLGAPGGIVTAYGSGNATIIAEATDPQTGSIQTATAIFNCPLVLPNPPFTAGSCYPGSEASALLSTVTIYNEGLNTTNWLVTGPSATGTPNVVHCGPGWTGTGGSVCVATYPIGTPVTFTAPAGTGAFGGWSSNCQTISPNPSTAAGPNTCTIVPTTFNETVGAIFN
jgi:hypothetical protein